MIHTAAKGLASLGRHGDTMLMHVSPEEVAGLQAIAKAHGTSLTVNPHTGMPEAFSFMGLLKGLLPTIAGFALGPGGFGLFDSALGAGLAVGGAGALASGSVVKGLEMGLGAYGGANLGSALNNAGLSAPGGTPPVEPTPPTGPSAATVGNGNIGMATQFPGQVSGVPSAATSDMGLSNVPVEGGQVGMANSFPSNMGGTGPVNPATVNTTASPTGNAWQGIKNLANSNTPMKDLQQAFGNVKAGVESGAKPVSLGSAVMSTLSPFAGGVVGSGLLDNSADPHAGQVYEQVGTNANGTPIMGWDSPQAFNPYRHLNLLTPNPNPLVLPPTSATMTDPNKFQTTPVATPMPFAQGGIIPAKGIAGLSHGGNPGGYLDGPGDGMSDSIHATIGDKQPAKLADGEFVMPADVVSHIGNGSSKAGAQKLYSMMDRIRKARTGTTKQGKQINPHKFMPV